MKSLQQKTSKHRPSSPQCASPALLRAYITDNARSFFLNRPFLQKPCDLVRDRSKKRGKSPTRDRPPAPLAAEPLEPPAFLSEYMDDGQGAVAELEGFTPVRKTRYHYHVIIYLSLIHI